MGMRIDASARTIVMVCTSCPWRTIATTRARGWSAAARHELQAHDRVSPNTKNRASVHR